MILYIIIIMALIVGHIQYAGKNLFFHDYLSPSNTQPIKGIFILLIFASHFSQYVALTDSLSQPYIILKQDLGQMVVVPFLFFSGYGIAVSVQKKGYEYICEIPIKRVLKVLVQFDFVVLLFGVVQIIRGNLIGIKKLILSLVAWDTLGNSNWYIFAILALYLISFFACYGLSKERKFDANRAAGLIITILSLCLIWILKRHRPGYCYNTILAYPAGYLYALNQERIEQFSFQSDRTYLLILSILCMLFYVFRKSWMDNLAAYEMAGILFGVIIVFLAAKFKINSKVLRYCGEHLFSLFILQRLPMLALSGTQMAANVPVYFIISLVLTFILSWLFDRTIPIIWRPLERHMVETLSMKLNREGITQNL